MLIVTAAQMKEIEQSGERYGLSSARLMENAGSAAATFIRRMFPVDSINCVVFCGEGNNGGDGFVIARRLRENGSNVIVVLVDGSPSTQEATTMYNSLKATDIPVLSLEDSRAIIENYTLHADLIIDAICGTGFREGRLDTPSLIATQMINDAPAAVVSLDIPTGVSCDRGAVAFGSVKADFTVVFQVLKPLHILAHSMEYCGEIQLVDIGLPSETLEDMESQFNFIDESLVMASLPQRGRESHKGSHGRALLICGSNHYRGAAVLAALGAMRVGVGVCTVMAPEVVCGAVINHIPEAIVAPLPVDGSGNVDFAKSLPILKKQLEKADVVLFGCGVGTEGGATEILTYILKEVDKPLLLDADALHILANHLNLLDGNNRKILLTPHPGEMSALSGIPVGEVQRNRLNTALDFATKYNVYLVLKGYGTILSHPDGRIFINDTGSQGLAKSGSGDVLAGMIAGLSAAGMPLEQAAASAVWLHGKSGELCAERLSSRSMLPSDMLEDLTRILGEYEREETPS